MNHDYIKLSFGDKVRFKCLRRGRCCSSGPNVGLTAFDICRIARFPDLDWRELKGKYVIAVIADMIAIPTLRDKGGGRCVFLEFTGGQPSCSVYPVRPMRCRLYPFLPSSPSRKGVIYVDGCCSGLNTDITTVPPWSLLKDYYFEVKFHYSRLHSLIFQEGFEPLDALEKVIEEADRLMTNRKRLDISLLCLNGRR